MSSWDENKTKRLFQELSFYNVAIEKIRFKKQRGLKSIDLLQELPFYDELNIYEMSKGGMQDVIKLK